MAVDMLRIDFGRMQHGVALKKEYSNRIEKEQSGRISRLYQRIVILPLLSC